MTNTTRDGIVCDRAFFEACDRCGVRPQELLSLPLKAFARHDDDPTDPTIKEVLEIRRSGFESIRTKKLELVLSEQEKVRIMFKEKVDPALVAVDEPWVVAGPGSGSAEVREQHSASEAIAMMAQNQRAMEEELKRKEK